MWKGVVSFGLVAIPIKLYAATEEHDTPLHQVHVADGSRIRYRRVCESEEKPVAQAEIARGYEMPDGQVVVLTADELANLPVATTHQIEVLRFVPAEQVDGMYLAKSYYLEADKAGAKPYVLLRDALQQAGTVALVKVALRQREALAMLRAHGQVLVLQTMLWPDEIRDPAALAPDSKIHARADEMKIAATYIEALAGDFEPEQYRDEYAIALRELVEEKIAGHEIVQAPVAEAGAKESNVIDLMSALKASVAAAKKPSGEQKESATVTPIRGKSKAKKAAPKKAAASKSAAKKSGTKKSTAKKTTTRKAGTTKSAAKKAKTRAS